MFARLILLLLASFSVYPALLLAAERPRQWLEARTPHFRVITNGSETQARRVARQFELVRAVYKTLNSKARVDPGAPVVILAAKNESTMRTLLPAFWEKKGQVHPAGIFAGDNTKHYVALRLDVRWESSYHVVYHEYIHLLMNLNLRWLPVWLDEGLAEFFANADLGEKKEAVVGRPSAQQVSLLRQNKLLPLDVLFSADHNSPYYTEENKATIFYAQSWAVTHYFMVGDRGAHTPQLLNYLALLQDDVPEAEARVKAFGDLEQLKQDLGKYLSLFSPYTLRVPAPGEIDEEAFTVRPMPAAELAAVQGDFLLHTQRPVEARAKLEEALRLDPNLAAAYESLGFLNYTQDDADEAADCFTRAVQLDSRSYLAHYYHAIFEEKRAHDEKSMAEVEASLRRSIGLNKEFAPAYDALAGLLVRHGKDLNAALATARHAVDLEPGVQAHHLLVASVLLHMRRTDEARTLLERLMRMAKTAQDRARAESMLTRAEEYQQYQGKTKRPGERANADEPKPSFGEQGKPVLERQNPPGPEKLRSAQPRRPRHQLRARADPAGQPERSSW